MGKDILLLLLVFVVVGTLTFLLIRFFKRLKIIEKDMWERKAQNAKRSSQMRREKVAQALKEAKEKNDADKKDESNH